MNDVTLPDACHCGAWNFERVVVQRKPGALIVTDFLACADCRAMYFAPVPAEAPNRLPPGHGIGIGGPQLDSDEKLKRDANEAAKAYRKPSRSGRLGPRGRK